jgi:hypothetical protein
MKDIYSMIHELGYDELWDLKNELDLGSFNLKQIVENKIKTLEINKKKCLTCKRSIDEVDEPLELTFGPKYLRRRAVFCGKDCMMDFFSRQEMLKNHLNEIQIKKHSHQTKIKEEYF